MTRRTAARRGRRPIDRWPTRAAARRRSDTPYRPLTSTTAPSGQPVAGWIAYWMDLVRKAARRQPRSARSSPGVPRPGRERSRCRTGRRPGPCSASRPVRRRPGVTGVAQGSPCGAGRVEVSGPGPRRRPPRLPRSPPSRRGPGPTPSPGRRRRCRRCRDRRRPDRRPGRCTDRAGSPLQSCRIGLASSSARLADASRRWSAVGLVGPDGAAGRGRGIAPAMPSGDHVDGRAGLAPGASRATPRPGRRRPRRLAFAHAIRRLPTWDGCGARRAGGMVGRRRLEEARWRPSAPRRSGCPRGTHPLSGTGRWNADRLFLHGLLVDVGCGTACSPTWPTVADRARLAAGRRIAPRSPPAPT